MLIFGKTMTSKPSLKSTSLERRLKSLTPFALKKMVATVIAGPVAGKIIKFSRVKFTLLGGTFDYSLVEDVAAAGIFWGMWEGAEVRFAKRFAGNDTIVELGSSVGVTLGTLAKAYPKAHFVCVEASPRNFKLLNKLRESLSKDLNIKFFNKAIDYSGVESIGFSETSYTGSKIADHETAIEKTVAIKTMTLSEILAAVPVTGQYTLVTDIEGAEADIFYQDEAALKQCDKIICELENTPKYSMQDQVDRLCSIGFETVEIYGNVYFLART